MNDSECVVFLQWALPQLHLRWTGFRKVRRQVCRRIRKRLQTLGLKDLRAYREYLERHDEEWIALDRMTAITVSSFYRDNAVWGFLYPDTLRQLAAADSTLRAWSIGCASGEEPYTLMLAWRMGIKPSGRGARLSVVATDCHEPVLYRARTACYPPGSLKQLPSAWRNRAFRRKGEEFCLLPEYREGVDFRRQDIRHALPDESFSLILCRNLVFTYFDESLQLGTLARILTRLRAGGALVIGRRETLPENHDGLTAWPGAERLGIYRKSA